MPDHAVVDHVEWVKARKAFLEKEKQFSRMRDELTAERMALPWEAVGKNYHFEGPNGRESLEDLFAGRSQLLIYHFMFDPEWSEGCPSCSFLADHYEPAVVHLAQRDVTLTTVSLAQLSKLQAFQQRMGWSFKWVSSQGSDFNRDFHVSHSDKEIEDGTAYYNYREGVAFPMREAPGLSAFIRDEEERIFHTYSGYARALENLISAYGFLDLAPMGRDEDGFAFPMEWVRHRDRYGD